MRPDQQIGTMGQTGFGGEAPGQQGGLIEPTLQQPRPVQRDRRDQHPVHQQRLRRPCHPGRGWPYNILPVAMFQRQNQLATIILIKKRCPPPTPWPVILQAVVAKLGLTGVVAGQGNTAKIATQPRDKRRVAPTWPAKAEILIDIGAANRAARRVNQV